MSRGTRDTICATIGLLIVIALLTTVAALDSPDEMDESTQSQRSCGRHF